MLASSLLVVEFGTVSRKSWLRISLDRKWSKVSFELLIALCIRCTFLSPFCKSQVLPRCFKGLWNIAIEDVHQLSLHTAKPYRRRRKQWWKQSWWRRDWWRRGRFRRWRGGLHIFLIIFSADSFTYHQSSQMKWQSLLSALVKDDQLKFGHSLTSRLSLFPEIHRNCILDIFNCRWL